MSVSNQLGFEAFPMPIGIILPFAGAFLPDKFLVCDGSAFDAAKYPLLNALLGGNSTPNLVNAFIGGGTAKIPVASTIVANGAAVLELTAEQIPSFSATIATINTTTPLNGTAQRKSSLQTIINSTYTSDPNGVSSGAATTATFSVAKTSLDVIYEGGASTSTAVPGITSFNPTYTEIQYIIRAAY